MLQVPLVAHACERELLAVWERDQKRVAVVVDVIIGLTCKEGA